MTQPPHKIVIRKITQSEFEGRKRSPRVKTQKRTRVFSPPGGGSFGPNDLNNIIPPSNARGFKIVRPMGGRYVRGDNPQGLGTEGPFGMEEWPSEDADFSAFEDLNITQVIFDVAD